MNRRTFLQAAVAAVAVHFGLKRRPDPRGGYNIAGTVTGRFSSHKHLAPGHNIYGDNPQLRYYNKLAWHAHNYRASEERVLAIMSGKAPIL